MYLTLWLRPFSMIASIGEKKNRQVVGLAVSCRVALQNLSSDSRRQAFGNAKYQKNEKMDIVRQVLAVTAQLPNFRHAVQAGRPALRTARAALLAVLSFRCRRSLRHRP